MELRLVSGWNYSLVVVAAEAEVVAAAAVASAAVAIDVFDAADDSRCADAVAIPIVPYCCQVFDANDNDNDFVDFQA